MKKSYYFVLICLLWQTFNLHAQKTGSYDTSITFMSLPRTLSIYVPEDYDKSSAYKLMICLHGLGDNSTNYRNALISSLKWNNSFDNTIFVCPDGGTDQNKDFFTPEGDEEIIEKAIELASKTYHIDSDFIVLQGFSLGGRSAAKYGLDHPDQFKGLLLNTPAFQGNQDANNQEPASLNFNYANTSKLPTYITVGDQDIYFNIINPLIGTIKQNNGIVHYEAVAGLGHSIPSPSAIAPVYPFFDLETQPTYDVDLFKLDAPLHSCSSTIDIKCHIQNNGNQTINSIDINYQLTNGSSGTHTWEGTIAPFQHQEISITNLSTQHGNQTISLNISKLNGSETDENTDNNTLEQSINVDVEAETRYQSEGFENGAENWIINQADDLFAWYTDTDVKKTGTTAIANFNTILLFYTQGDVQSFESPVVDLTASTSPQISFDLAYNYHLYTPPYFTENTIFADTLDISISNDCGATWQSIFKKGGDDLSTASNPITNPLSLNDVFFNPTAEEWEKISISLDAYKNSKEAIIRFNYISAMGGSIYIDNIYINGQGMSVSSAKQASFSIYPNPSLGQFRISAQNHIKALKIYDTNGRIVHSQTASKQNIKVLDVECTNLAKGIYQVEILTDKGVQRRKLILNQ